MSVIKGGHAAATGTPPDENLAANLVRTKLQSIYRDEPSAIEEEIEIVNTGVHSKHQKYMSELMNSGKSLADVQTAWHEYYQSLDDHEKHVVWQEFYEQHTRGPQRVASTTSQFEIDKIALGSHHSELSKNLSPEERARSMKDLHRKLLNKVSADGRLKTKHHVKSFVFSLAWASLVVGILFLVTNNELFLAKFIQPTKSIAASPIISDGSAVGPETKIIIPKLNLEAPIVNTVTDNAEHVLQDALELGVVQYPNTPNPGENGNMVVFGHSSSNLFNRGAHKFVFVRLHQLEVGDTYAINFNGIQYVYRVIIREVVKPNQVDVLYRQPEGKPAVSTLITCDPPGTANNRLVIVGEQVSPNPTANVASHVPTAEIEKPDEIPSNAPSLLSRIFGL